MSIRKYKQVFLQKKPDMKFRALIWCGVFALCLLLSVFTLEASDNQRRDYNTVQVFPFGNADYVVAPGGQMEQVFVARGKLSGGVACFYIQMFAESSTDGTAAVRLYHEASGEMMLESVLDFADIPKTEDFYGDLQKRVSGEDISSLGSWCEIADDAWYYRLNNGEKYRLEVQNMSETAPLYFLGNRTVQSGKMLVDGGRQTGFLNIAAHRQAIYTPSKLVFLMVLLTDATVLLALALVLFADVKTEYLYLLLAAGFGVVLLFAVTPLYGFDMRFHFDSTYVVSNRMMGVEDAGMMPSLADPEKKMQFYYRRACDDYSQFQFYKDDEVSGNYTDMVSDLLSPFADEDGKMLEAAQTHMGFVSEPLYMYIPQAIGFTVARLLGLEMNPMLQLARILTYGMFVLCVVWSIRMIPFGKRLLMVLALMPAVLVQVISISRDAMIIGLGFLLTAKVVQMLCREEKRQWKDWTALLLLSVLIAPCKMVYLPASCLCLLVAYKQFVKPAGKKGLLIIAAMMVAVVVLALMFVALNYDFIRQMLFADSVSVFGTQAYSVQLMVAEPLRTLFVFINSMRLQLGVYLTNAFQLVEINLGADDGMTLIIAALLLLETFCVDTDYTLKAGERCYMLLMFAGVFMLLVLAAFRWTPVEMDAIHGLQGRYLLPVLPLVSLSFYNNRIVRVQEQAAIITKIACCIFPAIALMNIYLWTITK